VASFFVTLHQETVNGEQQMNGNGTTASDNVRETSRVTTTNQLSTTLAPKVLMVINKDGLKTIMTLVSGKSMSESDSGSNLVADASNDSQDSNSGIVFFDSFNLAGCNML